MDIFGKRAETKYSRLPCELNNSPTPLACSWIPARYVLTLLTFFGFIIIYSLRVNLSVAIVSMVKVSEISQPNRSNVDVCPVYYNETSNSTSRKDGDFEWDERQQGIILGAFFYGYVITHIPGGRLAEIVGGKWLFGVGILFSSLFTLLTPLAAKWGFTTLVIIRVLTGLTEGITYPAMTALFSHWVPFQERGTLIGITGSGANIGTIITLPLAGLLCNSQFLGGWPSSFYVFGTLGCVWFIFWISLITEVPEKHPRISVEELYYITHNRKIDDKAKKLPFRAILTSHPLWALTLAKFSGVWGFSTFMTELPSYMAYILHYPIEINGALNSVMYAAEAVTLVIGGLASDYIHSRGYLKITTTRKLFETVAYIGQAICLALVPIAGCHYVAAVALLTTTMTMYGLSAGGEGPVVLDLSPEFAGTLTGIANGISNIAGMLAPLAVGLFTEHDQSMSQWANVFYLSAAIYVFGAFIFLLFGSAEHQSWSLESAPSVPVLNNELNKDFLEENPETSRIEQEQTSLLAEVK